MIPCLIRLVVPVPGRLPPSGFGFMSGHIILIWSLHCRWKCPYEEMVAFEAVKLYSCTAPQLQHMHGYDPRNYVLGDLEDTEINRQLACRPRVSKTICLRIQSTLLSLSGRQLTMTAPLAASRGSRRCVKLAFSGVQLRRWRDVTAYH